MKSARLSVKPRATDARQVPAARRRRAASKTSRPSSRSDEQELDDEERVAARLVHAPGATAGRAAPRRRRSASASSGRCRRARQRRQDDAASTRPPALRMSSSVRSSGCGAVDLVVAVGADDQQVAHVGCVSRPEQRRASRDRPLQVVEEQHQRVLRPREHRQEAPEHQLEAALRVLGGDLRRRRLRADEQLQLRHEVDDQLPVRRRAPPGARRASAPTSASLSRRMLADQVLEAPAASVA